MLKRITAVSALMIAALIIIFSFAACSGGNGGDKRAALTGRYAVSEIKGDPDGASLADVEAMYAELGYDINDYLYIEFFENGEYIIVLFGEADAGAYEHDGGELTLTSADGRATKALLNNGAVEWGYDNGALFVFKKS